MPRQKKVASSLPEKFEEFEKRMATPTRVIGGMVETAWAGRKMWRCPRCRGTTFDEGQSKVHECKVPRMADDPPPTDE